MILPIKLSALRNNEYAQFFHNLLDVLSRYGPAALGVGQEYARLRALTDAYGEAVNERIGSPLTRTLKELDARRGDALSGIVGLVHAFGFSRHPEVKAAAILLEQHLSGFGPSISRSSYQHKTSKLQKILSDWDTRPELRAAAALLRLDDWIAELSESNTAFDDCYVDRSVAAGTSKVLRMSNQRPAIDQGYAALTSMLHARLVAERHAEPWSTAVAAVNGLIGDYRDVLAGRKGARGKGRVGEGKGF